MHGIILIDKPKDFTSFDVVAVMRKIAQTKKIGHAGTLDPMATGVLPILVGRAVKLCDFLPDQSKRYTATFRLGTTTDTLDITGKVLNNRCVNSGKNDVLSALENFKGEISQIPPMFSAIKQNGVKLYELARKGIVVDRLPRSIKIDHLELINSNIDNNEYIIDVSCSKGTYIRSLCADIGEYLGCGAVLTALQRTESSGFLITDCISLQDAKIHPLDKFIIPLEKILESYSPITVTTPQATRFSNGGALDIDRLTYSVELTHYVRIYSSNGVFIGLGEVDILNNVIKVKYLDNISQN